MPGAPGSLVGNQTTMAAARRILHSRPVLLIAFAFAVMGDPVSSVAYAIEAALRARLLQLCNPPPPGYTPG